jgi:hypothetical protein
MLYFTKARRNTYCRYWWTHANLAMWTQDRVEGVSLKLVMPVSWKKDCMMSYVEDSRRFNRNDSSHWWYNTWHLTWLTLKVWGG